MPVIKIYANDFDFKVELKNKDGKTGTIYYIYLERRMMAGIPFDEQGNYVNAATKTEYDPIHVDDKNGLLIWGKAEGSWVKLKPEFQEAFAAYVAEKVLLGNGVPDGSV